MTLFFYHRSLTPTLSVLLGLALCETLVLHVVAVALWGWTVALVLGVVDVLALVAIVRLMHAIRRQPVTISDGMLTMRIGGLKVVPVPLDRVAGLRDRWDAAALKAPGVVNLALLTWPNVVVDVAPPLRVGRRQVHAVAHRLDDPAAFADALARLRDGDG